MSQLVYLDMVLKYNTLADEALLLSQKKVHGLWQSQIAIEQETPR